jgi:hypothetical protein
LGQCPQGALKIVKRLSAEFDQEAVEAKLKQSTRQGCPGHAARRLSLVEQKTPPPNFPKPLEPAKSSSPLAAWPIQLALVSPKADIFTGATLIVAADCVAFASRDFHRLFLGKGDALLIGCPKLDDGSLYAAKLGVILRDNPNIKELALPIMSVPCCSGLWHLAAQALERSKRTDVALKGWVFSCDGQTQVRDKVLNATTGI